MIHIEFEQPNYEKCSCCNQNVTRLTRFVYQDNDAFAYYYARFDEHSDPKEVKLLIVLVEWNEEGTEIIQKTGFPVRIWVDGDNFNVGLLHKEESAWQNLPEVEILDREQSLAHPQKADVFHITDHIVTEDNEIINYFS